MQPMPSQTMSQPSLNRNNYASNSQIASSSYTGSRRGRFNPTSYARAGSLGFGGRVFPNGNPMDHMLTVAYNEQSGSYESDRGSIINALSMVDREDELCRNYQCCGLQLTDLHALIDHFEEVHILRVDDPTAPGGGYEQIIVPFNPITARQPESAPASQTASPQTSQVSAQQLQVEGVGHHCDKCTPCCLERVRKDLKHLARTKFLSNMEHLKQTIRDICNSVVTEIKNQEASDVGADSETESVGSTNGKEEEVSNDQSSDSIRAAPESSEIQETMSFRHTDAALQQDAVTETVKVPSSKQAMMTEIKESLIRSLKAEGILLDVTRGIPKIPWTTLHYTLDQFNIEMVNWPAEVPLTNNKGIGGLSTKHLTILYQAIHDKNDPLTFRRKPEQGQVAGSNRGGQSIKELERAYGGTLITMPSESDKVVASTSGQKRAACGEMAEPYGKRFKTRWISYNEV